MFNIFIFKILFKSKFVYLLLFSFTKKKLLHSCHETDIFLFFSFFFNFPKESNSKPVIWWTAIFFGEIWIGSNQSFVRTDAWGFNKSNKTKQIQTYHNPTKYNPTRPCQPQYNLTIKNLTYRNKHNKPKTNLI